MPDEKTNGDEADKSPKAEEPEPISNSARLIRATENLIQDLICAKELFSVVLPVIGKLDDERKKKIDKLVDQLKTATKQEPKNINTVLNLKLIIERLLANIDKLSRANLMFRCNSLVLLVSKYDEYLSEVLRLIFRTYPDQLKNSEKMISYEDISDASTLSDVYDKFIGKEIDKFIRSSHEQQLEYLDNCWKIGLKEHFSSWNDFVELTERRNLFAHCGGYVNSQYLRVCQNHKINMGNKKKGTPLSVDREYFDRAQRIFFELCLRIGQGLHRRIFSENREDADSSLVSLGYALEKDEQWELARTAFEFALAIPLKYISSDEYNKLFLVNECICLKALGQNNKVLELLDGVDWSSVNTKYLLAVSVLRGQFPEAEKIMAAMNGKDPIDENSFRNWPLFMEFRKTDYFSRAFKSIYKIDYVPTLDEPIT